MDARLTMEGREGGFPAGFHVPQQSAVHVERLPFTQDSGLQDCAIGGQYRAIDYLRVHPDLILTAWSCELPKT